MSIFREMERRDSIRMYFCHDPDVGLKAIICIHDLTLGPALGGVRMSVYQTTEEAIRDVQRLARGMTYKSSAAGLDLGGGKAVIIGDPDTDKSPAFFRAFGRFVNELNGLYITAEDIGTAVSDMRWVHQETRWVTGLSKRMGGSGDPSPVTAFGVYNGMRATLEQVFSSDSFSGRSIAIQGIGKVGFPLACRLAKEGARIFVSDTNEVVLKKAHQQFGAIVVPVDEIHTLDVDIFAPCARGGSINPKTVKQIRAKIIAGAANNQLEDDKVQGPLLEQRGILYAPDFLINAGGVINVYQELARGGYRRDKALALAAKIYGRIKQVINIASVEGIPTTEAAMMMAKDRINRHKKKRN
ncbi:Glu/Leu/Phe/Val dehydrogenase [Patescibacteria group bacterium]|nr:Glu/Leu/Phe/Val dehydrogenase [Patescibacteria group bacterium]